MTPWIIIQDENGKEVGRKIKGRGRPPKGFAKSEKDGNWYAVSSLLKKFEEFGKKIDDVIDDKLQENVERVEKVRVSRRSKVVQAEHKTTVEKFCKGCHVLSSEVGEDGIIILHGPIVCGPTGLDDFTFDTQPVFNRIEIDTTKGTVSGWGG